MSFNLKDIFNQMIYLLKNHSHSCHIRNKTSHYLYINPAMRELLNLPKGVPIEEKGLSTIKLDRANF